MHFVQRMARGARAIGWVGLGEQSDADGHHAVAEGIQPTA
jgi:hypothetical protein